MKTLKLILFGILFGILFCRHAFGAVDGNEFFEQKVRPVLVEHCYSCHSSEAKKLKGNLFLDSKAGWQKGGDNGAAVIVPGKPQESLLIRSIQHLEADLEMPPNKPKLSDAVIAAYDAPFPDDRYTAAVRVFPALVPTSTDDPASADNIAV